MRNGLYYAVMSQLLNSAICVNTARGTNHWNILTWSSKRDKLKSTPLRKQSFIDSSRHEKPSQRNCVAGRTITFAWCKTPDPETSLQHISTATKRFHLQICHRLLESNIFLSSQKLVSEYNSRLKIRLNCRLTHHLFAGDWIRIISITLTR